MAQYGAFFSLETMGDTSPTVIEHYNQTQGNAHKGDEACTKVPTGGVGQGLVSHSSEPRKRRPGWLAQYEQQNACYFCAAGEADRLAREGAAA
jgi:hypothetical protein